MDYISVEEAIDRPGLRLVLSAGVPGPWGEAAKAILAHKDIAYTPVRQVGGGDNAALREWTGQDSAPVAVLDDLPPVCHWLDLLMLAERLAPDKPLLPLEPAARAEVIGLSALVAGVDGFGWNRRLQLMEPILALDDPPEGLKHMARKYACTAEAAAGAQRRLDAICAELDARLGCQAARGSEYFSGDAPTAVDIYWASFLVMVMPLGPEDNPMDPGMRQVYEGTAPAARACISERLVQHRDMMYARHISLPLDF